MRLDAKVSQEAGNRPQHANFFAVHVSRIALLVGEESKDIRGLGRLDQSLVVSAGCGPRGQEMTRGSQG